LENSQRLKRDVPHILKSLNDHAEQKFRQKVANGGDAPYEYFTRARPGKSLINIGFDTEDNSKGHVHLLCFYDGKFYYEFFDKDIALYFLIFAQFPFDMSIVWCVNTEYDINNLHWGDDRKFLIDRMYNKSNFIMGRLRHNPRVRFYDVMNYYSLSAAKVGELYGLKKRDFDFNKHRKFRADGTVVVSKKEILYCRGDTKIAQRAGCHITGMFDGYEITQTATIASAAIQIYLKRFDPTEGLGGVALSRYMVDQDDVYNSYYGGRVECFHYGKISGRLRYYDINSLYPHVMKKYLYPDPMSPANKRRTADIDNGVVYCRVRVPLSMYLPPLPVRHAGKLMFPVGTFDGVWCVDELNNAVNWGVKIIKVYRAYEWKNVIDLFSEYVDHFYKLRQRSRRKADNYFYKVIMNSLYGKFAEKRRSTVYVPLEQGGVFDPIVYDMAQQTVEYFPRHNNVVISSYVTAYGRIELYNLMQKILDNNGKLLYCDTDSVIYKGGKLLQDSKQLGGVKKEADIKKAEFLGAKYYRYWDTAGNEFDICKGVPKAYQGQMFEKGEATYMKPIRYREALRRKLQANVWVQFTKHAKADYDKRVVLSNGLTRPIVLKP
jgi:hypothetical protein